MLITLTVTVATALAITVTIRFKRIRRRKKVSKKYGPGNRPIPSFKIFRFRSRFHTLLALSPHDVAASCQKRLDRGAGNVGGWRAR
jgi:hypothetical protein